MFRLRCAACHGAEGYGDGPAGVRLPRAPADFSRKQPSPECVRAALFHGISGTAMTAMQQNLSESDTDALVLFVRSLFEGGAQRLAMMTMLITALTLILVAIVALWAASPRLRAWIEQPKYDVLRQIREHEDAHAETKPPAR